MDEHDAELERMKLPELQKLFECVVGEPTRCPNRRFLVRRIRETRGEADSARVGRSSPTRPPKGGTKRQRGKPKRSQAVMMVLPVRLDADVVERLDKAWRRRGLRSRMDLFRHALRAYLLSVGEREVAALVGPEP